MRLDTGGTGSKVRPVVSCKGTTCQYGLLDSFGLSEEIHDEFYEKWHDVKLPHKFKIAVGGCPNNCVKPNLNDLGIVGQLIPNYDEDMCSGCKKCGVVKACPIDAVKLVDGIMELEPGKCINCGRCIGTCHFDAIEDGTYGYKMISWRKMGKENSHRKACQQNLYNQRRAYECDRENNPSVQGTGEDRRAFF